MAKRRKQQEEQPAKKAKQAKEVVGQGVAGEGSRERSAKEGAGHPSAKVESVEIAAPRLANALYVMAQPGNYFDLFDAVRGVIGILHQLLRMVDPNTALREQLPAFLWAIEPSAPSSDHRRKLAGALKDSKSCVSVLNMKVVDALAYLEAALANLNAAQKRKGSAQQRTPNVADPRERESAREAGDILPAVVADEIMDSLRRLTANQRAEVLGRIQGVYGPGEQEEFERSFPGRRHGLTDRERDLLSLLWNQGLIKRHSATDVLHKMYRKDLSPAATLQGRLRELIWKINQKLKELPEGWKIIRPTRGEDGAITLIKTNVKVFQDE